MTDQARSPIRETPAHALIEKIWAHHIEPALHDYIRIPNVSEAFDSRWDHNGYMLQAVDLTEAPAVVRGLVLVRVRAPLEMRTAVLKEAERFKARVVDSSTEGFALEATDDPEKLDEFVQVMRSYGDIEVIRSGAVAMSLDAKKLRLQPPVPAATRPGGSASVLRARPASHRQGCGRPQ